MATECGTEFVGGPMDGHLRVFPGDEPPKEVQFDSTIDWPNKPQLVRSTYRSELSPRDDGPLWLFHYVPEVPA